MPKTKVKTKAAAPAQVLVVSVDRLVPTPDNRRKPISDASVRSLAQSIKSDGLLQPIIVRHHPAQSDRFEIRAGERRWRAAKLAGLKEVFVIVRKLDNEQALTVTVAENMLRKDLHPLEEAEAIQLAFEREYDLKAIASRLGKSIGYLARRASLTKLSKAWRSEVAKADSDASRLSAAHLELIARLPEATQDSLADDHFWPVFGRGFPTVKELRQIVDGSLRSLGAMPWDPVDETIDPRAGSCTNCPKRSSQQPTLFPEDNPGKNGKAFSADRCLDPPCFDRKHVAFVQRCECKHRAQHPNLRLVEMGVGTINPAIQEAFGDRIERLYGPKLVKAGEPNAVPVMQVDGPKAGKLVFIDMGESVSVNGNGRSQRPRGTDGNVVPLTMDERRARLQKRRDAFVVKHVQEFLRGLTPVKALEIVSPWTQRNINLDAGATVFNPVALLTAFGSTKRADYVDGGEAWKEYDALRESEPNREAAAALWAIAQVWVKRLNIQGGHTVSAQAEDAKRMCQILGVDFFALFTEARKVIPQPKSWTIPEEPDPPVISTEPASGDVIEPGEAPFDSEPEECEVAAMVG